LHGVLGGRDADAEQAVADVRAVVEQHGCVVGAGVIGGTCTRFGEVEILTFGDLATSERLGLIHVEIESLKERPYWGPSALGSEKMLLPCYIALRMNVMSSTGASWDGSHHLNAGRTVPGSSSRLTFANATDLQVGEIVRSILDQLPTLHQHLATSDY
jgi:hypothetical protein